MGEPGGAKAMPDQDYGDRCDLCEVPFCGEKMHNEIKVSGKACS
jgi:hypothetical protein